MLYLGDCLDVLARLEENSVDSVITDPPYGLGKQPDIFKVLQAWMNDENAVVNGGGFMGKEWDKLVPGPHYWKAVYRVMKPGAIALMFGGTRTYDLTTLALRMAGFEIRDCINWIQAQGFPKSHDIYKALKKKGYCTCDTQKSKHDMRHVRETDLQKTVNVSQEPGKVLFKGLQEQSLSSDRPEAEYRHEGCEQSGLERRRYAFQEEGELQGREICSLSETIFADGAKRRLYNGTQVNNGKNDGQIIEQVGGCPSQESRSGRQQATELGTLAQQPNTQNGGSKQLCARCGKPIIDSWNGYGTALKPAWEPIIVAMKPIEGTFAENALTHGVAGMWIDGCRIGVDTIDVPQLKTTDDMCRPGQNQEWTGEIKQHQGRFPANLILSHTPECKRVGTRKVKSKKPGTQFEATNQVYGKYAYFADTARYGDENGLEEIESWECSENCPVAMLDRQSGITRGSANARTNKGTGNNCYGVYETIETQQNIWGDKGGASRFFYCAKASTKERNQGLEERNIHPTVKPLELMRYLCRLTKTPTGGIVLDPFMGAGTTGMAAVLEDREFIGIELMPEYFEIAEQRIKHAKSEQLALI